MSKVKSQISNVMQARIDQIAQDMRKACAQIIEPSDARFAASDAMREAGETLQATRLSVASEIAELSQAGQWTPGEVSYAAKQAVSTGNGDDRSAKALATFISEMRTIAHPNVRAVFGELLEACEEAWDVEAQDLENAKISGTPAVTPAHKWAKRKYHLVMNVCRAVKDADVNLRPTGDEGQITAEDIVSFAEINNPDHDSEKVAKRLKAIIDTVQAIYLDFHHDDLKVVVDYLGTLNAAELLAARNKFLSEQADEEASTPTPMPAPPVSTPVVTVDAAAAALDAMLNDLPVGLAA